ncbi:MAG: serine/threonine protein kinase [Candidatus Obscuribacterales bacterium]|nr:serine/threonine protein kinase [Candidatus Obscuribacterales bacterium]
MHDDRLVGQTIDSQFEIVARLGQGGNGVVYKARQLQVGRTVALKFFNLPIQAHDDYLERFRQEGRILSGMNHPGIMRCFMLGLYQDKIPYLVFEFVEGPTLRQLIAGRGKLGWREAAQIAIKICEALDYGESCGVLHRDLKPENIIVRDNAADGYPEVKILDYGLAKFLADPNKQVQTNTGIIIGTPAYMSPEQCMGERASSQSDIYSLGVVLFEMIDGRPPFESGSPVVLLSKHVSEIPRQPETATPDTPAAILAIISKALAKSPANRFGSASQMARALKSALAGDTVGITAPHRFGRTSFASRALLPKLTLLFCLVGATAGLALAMADPGIVRPEFLSRFLAHDQKSLSETAKFLERLHKSKAASLFYEAAAVRSPISASSVETLGKAVDCAAQGGESTRAEQLSKAGLRQTLLLCNSQRGTQLAKRSAELADKFSSHLLDTDLPWSNNDADETAQTCAALIRFYQRQPVNSQYLQPVATRARDVYLLYLSLESRSRRTVADAPERICAFLKAAETTESVSEQKFLLSSALHSINAFPDANLWSPILKTQLSQLGSDSKSHAIMTFGTVAAIGSLSSELPNPRKRQLIELAVANLNGQEVGMRKIRTELEHYLANRPDSSDLAFLLKFIDAKTLFASGQEAAAFSELCRAYYDSRKEGDSSAALQEELNTQASRLLTNGRARELERTVMNILCGKLRVPPTVAERLARAWLNASPQRVKQELVKTPVATMAPEQKLELLSLRGLLLGLAGDFARSDNCFKQFEELLRPPIEKTLLEYFFAHRAEVCIVKREFVRAAMFARKSIQQADLAGDLEYKPLCNYLLLVARICSDDTKVEDYYQHPNKYGLSQTQLAQAASVKLNSYLVEGKSSLAKKFIESKLFLADDKSLERNTRYFIFLAAGDLFAENGEFSKARQAYKKSAAVASEQGANSALSLECRQKLLGLDLIEDKLDFRAVYDNRQSYGATMASMAEAARNRVVFLCHRGLYSDARKYLQDKLFLADEPTANINARLNLLSLSAELENSFQNRGAAIATYRKALSLATNSGKVAEANRLKSVIASLEKLDLRQNRRSLIL